MPSLRKVVNRTIMQAGLNHTMLQYYDRQPQALVFRAFGITARRWILRRRTELDIGVGLKSRWNAGKYTY